MCISYVVPFPLSARCRWSSIMWEESFGVSWQGHHSSIFSGRTNIIMGRFIFFLAFFAGKTTLEPCKLYFLILNCILGLEHCKVSAEGIAPFGVVPVELIRYFHVRYCKINIENVDFGFRCGASGYFLCMQSFINICSGVPEK